MRGFEPARRFSRWSMISKFFASGGAKSRRERAIALEPLEDRTLLTINATLTGSFLSITGDEDIALNVLGNTVQVGNYLQTFDRTAIGSVKVDVSSATHGVVVNLQNLTPAQLPSVSTSAYRITVIGTQYDDTIMGSSFKDSLSGGAGNDFIYSGGSAAADYILGGEGNDTIYGSDGSDIILAGNGVNEVHGRDGNDLIADGTGSSYLYGENGNDIIGSDAGSDLIVGGDGTDCLVGGDGQDTLIGNSGVDTLDGGSGSDTYFGDKGIDVFTESQLPPPLDYPSISVQNIEVPETPNAATFTVILSNPYSQPITITWLTADGTAKAAKDYTASSGSITIDAGATAANIRVPILSDNVYEFISPSEPNESFNLQLKVGDSAVAQASATIIDDDYLPLPELTFKPRHLYNPNQPTYFLEWSSAFRIERPITFHYSTIDYTAIKGRDYYANSGSVTFTPNANYEVTDYYKALDIQPNIPNEPTPAREFYVHVTTPNSPLVNNYSLLAQAYNQTASSTISDRITLGGNSPTRGITNQETSEWLLVNRDWSANSLFQYQNNNFMNYISVSAKGLPTGSSYSMHVTIDGDDPKLFLSSGRSFDTTYQIPTSFPLSGGEIIYAKQPGEATITLTLIDSGTGNTFTSIVHIKSFDISFKEEYYLLGNDTYYVRYAESDLFKSSDFANQTYDYTWIPNPDGKKLVTSQSLGNLSYPGGYELYIANSRSSRQRTNDYSVIDGSSVTGLFVSDRTPYEEFRPIITDGFLGVSADGSSVHIESILNLLQNSSNSDSQIQPWNFAQSLSVDPQAGTVSNASTNSVKPPSFLPGYFGSSSENIIIWFKASGTNPITYSMLIEGVNQQFQITAGVMGQDIWLPISIPRSVFEEVPSDFRKPNSGFKYTILASGVAVLSGTLHLTTPYSDRYGLGWTIDGLDRLAFDRRTATLQLSSGETVNFNLFNSGETFNNYAGTTQLSLVAYSGSRRFALTPLSDGFKVSSSDGPVRTFDMYGRLVKWSSPGANAISYDLVYGNNNELEQVIDNRSGKSIEYYYVDGILTEITDFGGGSWTFQQGNSGSIEGISTPSDPITGDSIQFTFAYGTAARLTEITSTSFSKTISYNDGVYVKGGGRSWSVKTRDNSLLSSAGSGSGFSTLDIESSYAYYTDEYGLVRRLQMLKNGSIYKIRYMWIGDLDSSDLTVTWSASNGFHWRTVTGITLPTDATVYGSAGVNYTFIYSNDGSPYDWAFRFRVSGVQVLSGLGSQLTEKNVYRSFFDRAEQSFISDASSGSLVEISESVFDNDQKIRTFKSSDADSYTNYDYYDSMDEPYDGLLSKITVVTSDSNGVQVSNTVEYVYNTLGQIIVERRSSLVSPKSEIHYSYDVHGYVDVVTTNLSGGLTQSYKNYDYDAFGRLRRLTDGDGNFTEWTYGSDGRLLLVESRGRQSTSQGAMATKYEYGEASDNRRYISTKSGWSDAAGTESWLSETMVYFDDQDNSAVQIEGYGTSDARTTTWEYDGWGNVVRRQDSLGKVTTYNRSNFGWLTQKTDNAEGMGGLIQTYSYNSTQGQVVQSAIVSGVIQQQTLTYNYFPNPFNSLLKDVAGPLSTHQIYNHDTLGVLQNEQGPFGEQTTYGYDSLGRLSKVTDPLSRVQLITYNTQDQPVEQSLGGRTRYSIYDSVGRVTTDIDPDGILTAYTYDGGDRLASRSTNGRTVGTWFYDEVGNLVAEGDGNGNYTRHRYDVMGQLIATLYPDPANVLNASASDPYAWVADENNLVNNLHLFRYNAVGDLIWERTPEGIERSYSFDISTGIRDTYEFSQLIERQQLDVFGRVVTDTVYKSGVPSKTQYAYDELDRVTNISILDPSNGDALISEEAFTYDALGRMLTHTEPRGAAYVTTSYAYVDQYSADPDVGLPVRTVTISDGIAPPVIEFYNKVGELVKRQDSMGYITRYIYDDAGRLVSTVLPATEVGSLSESVIYDKAGNIIASTDRGGATTEYVLDSQGRIVAVISPSVPDSNNVGTTKYSTFHFYDNAGNEVRSVDSAGVVTTYVYDSLNRLRETYIAEVLVSSSTFARQVVSGQLIETQTDAVSTAGGMVSTSYVSNAAAHTTKTVFANGRQILETFDIVGNEITYSESNGSTQGTQKSWIYDASNNVSYAYTYLNNAVYETVGYTYLADGNVSTITASASGTTHYFYDARGNLTQQTDSLNRSTWYSYDFNGNLTSTTTADLATIVNKYNSVNQRTEVDDQRGGVTLYEYTAAGDIYSVTDPNENTTSYQRDALGRVMSETSPLGTRSYHYDGRGNVVWSNDRDNRIITYKYDNQSRKTSETWWGSNGTTIVDSMSFTYDNAGNLTSAGDSNAAYQLTYDSYGRLLDTSRSGVANSLNYNIRTSYDALGRGIASVATNSSNNNSLIMAESHELDALGRLKTAWQLLGSFVNMRVDAVFRADGQVDQFDRYIPITSVSPLLTSKYTYDAGGQLSDLKHQYSGTILAGYHWDRNSVGNITYETNLVTGIQRSFTYDAAGQLLSETGVSSISYTNPTNYTIGGNPIPIESADLNNDGKKDIVTVGVFFGVVSVLMGNGDSTFQTPQTVSPNSFILDLKIGDVDGDGYLDIVYADALTGSINIILNGGHANSGGSWNFGAPVSYSVANANFTRVALGDLNDDGYLDIVAATPTGVYTWLNDETGQFGPATLLMTLTTVVADLHVSDIDGDDYIDILFDQTSLNQMTVLLGAGDGTFSTPNLYATPNSPQGFAAGDVNGDGFIDLVGTTNNGLVFVMPGQLGGTFGTNIVTDLAGTTSSSQISLQLVDFNHDGKLDVAFNRPSADLIDIAFGDGDGTFDQLEHITVGTGPSSLTVADYNNDGWLDIAVSRSGANRISIVRRATDPGSAKTYSYDAAGNRIGGAIVIGAGNLLMADDDSTYQYDGEGNRTLEQDKSTLDQIVYAWDYRNRLTQVMHKHYVSPGNYTTTKMIDYTYDVFDRLIKKVVDTDGNSGTAPATTDVTQYVWDNNQIMFTLDGAGRVTQRYLYGIGQDDLLAVQDITYDSNGVGTGTVQWMLYDHQGSIRDIIDSSRNVVGHRDFDAFGNVVNETTTSLDLAFAFTGKMWDADAGLYYYNARWYDPKAGRFLSQDPIGFNGGDTNLYRYVGNNPVNMVDPSGKEGQYAGVVSNDYKIYERLRAIDPFAFQFSIERNIRLMPRPEWSWPLEWLRFNNFDIEERTDSSGSYYAFLYSPSLSEYEKLNALRSNIRSDVHFKEWMKKNQLVDRVPSTISPAPGTIEYSVYQGQIGEQVYDSMAQQGATPGEISWRRWVDTGNYWLGPQGLAWEIPNAFGLAKQLISSPSMRTAIIKPPSGDLIVVRLEANAYRRLLELENAAGAGSHFLSRHGARTTIEQQFERAESGLTPDGFQGNPVNSSRFFSNRDQLKAVQAAYEIYDRTGRLAFTFDARYLIGEGATRDGLEYRLTSNVRAVFFPNGSLKTLFPQIDRINP